MSRLPERERLLALSVPDRALWAQEGVVLAGMDEVGRGPLAGPVVVCCAAMPPEPLIERVNDSKQVSELRREALFPVLTDRALGYSLSWVGAEVINEINIFEATKLAFQQAFEAMPITVTDVLIDAMTNLKISARQHSMIHGDELSYSIACASIIAKVSRDRYMVEQDAIYPEYGFAKHKGYGTKEHIAALKKYGPCPLHRDLFVRKYV